MEKDRERDKERKREIQRATEKEKITKCVPDVTKGMDESLAFFNTLTLILFIL